MSNYRFFICVFIYICCVIPGSISHHDMWDYLHLSKAGYTRVFEPVHELLLQILDEDDEKLERNANLETLSIDEN